MSKIAVTHKCWLLFDFASTYKAAKWEDSTTLDTNDFIKGKTTEQLGCPCI